MLPYKVKNHKLWFWRQTIKESQPSNLAQRQKAQTRKLGIKSKLCSLLVLDLLDITMNVFCGDIVTTQLSRPDAAIGVLFSILLLILLKT